MKQYEYVSERNKGSIRNINLSPMEYIEYRQTGMIKIKETPLSFGELFRSKYEHIDYYDWVRKTKSQSKQAYQLR